MLRKDYCNAILVAFELDSPWRILSILRDVKSLNQDSITGSSQLDTTLSTLDLVTLEKLLNYIRDWNTHSKHATIAQSLLYLIFTSYSQETLLSLPGIKELMDALEVYSQRHFSHQSQILKQSYLLEYTLSCMDLLE